MFPASDTASGDTGAACASGLGARKGEWGQRLQEGTLSPGQCPRQQCLRGRSARRHLHYGVGTGQKGLPGFYLSP